MSLKVFHLGIRKKWDTLRNDGLWWVASTPLSTNFAWLGWSTKHWTWGVLYQPKTPTHYTICPGILGPSVWESVQTSSHYNVMLADYEGWQAKLHQLSNAITCNWHVIAHAVTIKLTRTPTHPGIQGTRTLVMQETEPRGLPITWNNKLSGCN